MSYIRSLADALAPKLIEYIREERPLPRRNHHGLLTPLLSFQIVLFLSLSVWLFIAFENQVETPGSQQLSQMGLLNETTPQPNYLYSLIGSFQTPLALNPAKSGAQLRAGQILVKVSNVTKIITTGLSARLAHDTLTHYPIQKNLIMWYVHYHRYVDGEEEIAVVCKPRA